MQPWLVSNVQPLLVSNIGRTAEFNHGAECRLSVVAPCYNEAEGLAELHRRVTAVCQATVGENYEIILVNDGSQDNTLSMIVALVERDPHVAMVNLTRNYGHQIALSAGLENCRGQRILIID